LHFYYAHNEARIEYLDHQSLDYNEYSNEFKALGLSENDYKMFMSAHYYDTNVFNDDCLNSMVQLKQNNSKLLTKEKIIEALSVFKDEIMSYSLISFGLILAFYFLITSEYTLELVSTLTITAFEIAYLVIGGRYPIRVLFIPMLGCLVIIVYFCLEHFNQYLSSNKNRYYIVILFILCYVILSSGFLTLKKQNGWGGDKEKVMSLVQELNKNPENLYVWDDYSVDLFGAYSQYEIVDYNILENVVFDWDWKVMLPVNIQKTSDFLGDSNIYLHSINDNIYWVGSNNIDIKRAFIREHYYEDIDYAILCYIEDEPIISFTRNINYYNTLPTSYIVSFDMKANDIDNLINITISNIKGLDITSYDKIYIQLSDVTETTCYTYECYMLEHNTLETNIPQNTWNEIDLVNCSLLLNANNNIFIVPYDYSISL